MWNPNNIPFISQLTLIKLLFFRYPPQFFREPHPAIYRDTAEDHQLHRHVRIYEAAGNPRGACDSGDGKLSRGFILRKQMIECIYIYIYIYIYMYIYIHSGKLTYSYMEHQHFSWMNHPISQWTNAWNRVVLIRGNFPSITFVFSHGQQRISLHHTRNTLAMLIIYDWWVVGEKPLWKMMEWKSIGMMRATQY